MTYSKSTLQKLAKEVIHRHPDIATAILKQIPQPKRKDIDRIPEYFTSYCQVIGIDCCRLSGPVFKSAETERKKVFISAMACMFYGTRQFSKTISETLKQHPSATTRMVDEVIFRYEKDYDFKIKVDQILNKLENDSRAA